MIDLQNLRAELQRKIEAIDVILGRTIAGRAIKRGKKVHQTRKAGRRRMSAAGRARLAAIARARWAKAKRAGKKAL